jgi:hypothetical protein
MRDFRLYACWLVCCVVATTIVAWDCLLICIDSTAFEQLTVLSQLRKANRMSAGASMDFGFGS